MPQHPKWLINLGMYYRYGVKRKFSSFAGRNIRRRIVTPSPRPFGGAGTRRRVFRTAGRSVRRRIVFGQSRGAIARVAARRLLVRRALTGGALAAGALAGYGMYRGIKRYRRRTARRVHVSNRKRFGERPGASRTKEKLTQNQADIPHQSYILHDHAASQIGGMDRTDVRTRQHNDINLRGLRMNLRVRHNGLQPAVLTLMLVTLKNSGSSSNQPGADFFVGRGNEEDKDFGQAGISGSDYVDLGYNKERLNVLWYKRIKLAPRGEYTAQSPYRNMSARNFFEINEYVKLNRQLNFATDSAIDVEDPQRIRFLHYIAYPFTAAATPVTGQYSMTRKIHAVWREVNH